MVYELERVLRVCNGFLCSISVTYDVMMYVVVDGMLRRTAGKSVRYAGELVVPEPLEAVW